MPNYDPFDPYGLKKQQMNVPMQGMLPNQQPQPGMGIMPMADQNAAPQAGSEAANAQMAALLENYGDVREADTLEKQMAQAEALRMATPEGRSSGRVYTAANPLEHLGKGIGDYKLMKRRQAYDKRQAELDKNIGGRTADYGKIILKDL